ncbi:hypothetical protein GTP55_00370 [Duganella sp. FT109W]|uniref:Uncharacterized protein n=1 Tax=Duganella margarita TaxID=2692170 RepID=A0ABW9WBW8_9BURK|nr:hypothetical protein [Duganella margarita]MYN37820.1 hypothetical protein [Duganella margarita]
MHIIKTLLVGLLMCLMTALHAEDLTERNQHDWLERDWEVRYLLFVGPEKDRAQDYREARRMNARFARKGSTYPRLHGGVLMRNATTFPTPKRPAIATILISFDAEGNVTGGDNDLRGFTGRLSFNDLIMLVPPDYPATKPYALPYLRWSQEFRETSPLAPAHVLSWIRSDTRKGGKAAAILVTSVAGNGQRSCSITSGLILM